MNAIHFVARHPRCLIQDCVPVIYGCKEVSHKASGQSEKGGKSKTTLLNSSLKNLAQGYRKPRIFLDPLLLPTAINSTCKLTNSKLKGWGKRRHCIISLYLRIHVAAYIMCLCKCPGEWNRCERQTKSDSFFLECIVKLQKRLPMIHAALFFPPHSQSVFCPNVSGEQLFAQTAAGAIHRRRVAIKKIKPMLCFS